MIFDEDGDVSGIKVLVVDDEPNVTDTYSIWLEENYDVEAAYGGEEALEVLDETIDVVLLDRRMPRMSGDEVLEKIHEIGLEPKVIMVTAVKPDFDIIGMGCDDYLVKPISKHDLFDTINNVMRLGEYSEELRRYYTLVSKKAALESEKTMGDLDDNQEYQELKREITELEDRIKVASQTVDAEGFISTTRNLMKDRHSYSRGSTQ